MKLTSINIHPVKSLAGISVNSAQVNPYGLLNDRNMMLVDDNGIFISQRKYPQMALIKTKLLNNVLTVSAPNMSEITLNEFSHRSILVDVWGDACHGFVAQEKINQWFSQYLDFSVKLVKYDHQQPRVTDPQYSQANDIVSFADGFPLLVISQASLDDLNTRLNTPVTMKHFRTNLVIDGCEAYAEDNFKNLKIGNIEFEAVKPCSRCVLTTVNPKTGIKSSDTEPLRTLSQYRKTDKGVIFGMNLIPRGKGSIKLGDECHLNY
jgi:uncharacterized protein YcbX